MMSAVGDWVHATALWLERNAENVRAWPSAAGEVAEQIWHGDQLLSAGKSRNATSTPYSLAGWGYDRFGDLGEYASTWYLSPHQHIVETLLSVVILVPILTAFCWACFRRVRAAAQSYRTNQAVSPRVPVPMWQKCWAVLLLMSVALQLHLKAQADDPVNHPAFLAQPCHIHSIFMALASFSDDEWSRAILHVATTLWWGPFLAFIAPDLPILNLDIFAFYFEHTLLMVVIAARLTSGAYWMYRDRWMNWFGFFVLAAYHWWFLAPFSMISGVNLATMMSPPPTLEFMGRYYRVLWFMCCALLQLFAVTFVKLLAKHVAGVLPPRGAPSPITSTSKKAGSTAVKSGTKTTKR